MGFVLTVAMNKKGPFSTSRTGSTLHDVLNLTERGY